MICYGQTKPKAAAKDEEVKETDRKARDAEVRAQEAETIARGAETRVQNADARAEAAEQSSQRRSAKGPRCRQKTKRASEADEAEDSEHEEGTKGVKQCCSRGDSCLTRKVRVQQEAFTQTEQVNEDALRTSKGDKQRCYKSTMESTTALLELYTARLESQRQESFAASFKP